MYYDRPLTPEELVLRGGDPTFLMFNEKCISINTPYAYVKYKYQMNKYNEGETILRFLHRRAADRTTLLQKWLQRKMDERLVDFGTKSGFFGWVLFSYWVIYKIAKGILKTFVHFIAEKELDYNPPLFPFFYIRKLVKKLFNKRFLAKLALFGILGNFYPFLT